MIRQHDGPARLNTECPCCKHSQTFPETNHVLKTPHYLQVRKCDRFQKACFFACITFWSAWYKGLQKNNSAYPGWLAAAFSESESLCQTYRVGVWDLMMEKEEFSHVNDPWPYRRMQEWWGRWWTLQIGLQGFIMGGLLHAGTLRI